MDTKESQERSLDWESSECSCPLGPDSPLGSDLGHHSQNRLNFLGNVGCIRIDCEAAKPMSTPTAE